MKVKAKKSGQMDQGNAFFCRRNKVYEAEKVNSEYEVKDEIGIVSAGNIHTMSESFFNEYFTIVT